MERIGYVYSDICLNFINSLPRIPKRASMVHELISSYDLIQHMKILEPKIASFEDLTMFHSSDYLHSMKRIDDKIKDSKYLNATPFFKNPNKSKLSKFSIKEIKDYKMIKQNKDFKSIDQNNDYKMVDQNKYYYKTVDQNKDYKSIDQKEDYKMVDQNKDYKTIDQNKDYKMIDQNKDYKTIDQNKDYKTIDQNKEYKTADHNKDYKIDSEMDNPREDYTMAVDDQREDYKLNHEIDELPMRINNGNNAIKNNGDYKTDGDSDDDDIDDDSDDDRNSMTESFEEEEETCEEYGFAYDCPLYAGVFEVCQHLAGSSLSAADSILEGSVDVAINWFGGWHHAMRDKASGFCYINDIVLCILRLLKKFQRVLYIDLDLHHGDGVQEAFYHSPRVMTISFHKLCNGFFPGTGFLDEIGKGKGLYHSINVPYKDGLDDSTFISLFDNILSIAVDCYNFEVIVCQLGADCLVSDPNMSANLTDRTYLHAVQKLLSFGKPIVFLGGGGYNHANTSRCWTKVTADLLGKNISSDIPDNRYFVKYTPDYQLDISPGNMKNNNSQDYIDAVIKTVKENLSSISRGSK